MTARLSGAVVTIVGMLLLGFVLQASVISRLQHERAQQVRYAEFRAELARGEAPVGQVDGETNQLLPLGTTMAILEIPALAVREIVVEGTTSGVLAEGAGHRRDTPLPGQAGTCVIMGRQAMYGGPFRDLALLVKGDTITAITGQGSHEYRVRGVRRAGDPEPTSLVRGAGRLTMVTADGPAYAPTGGLWVDADLVSPAHPAPARPLTFRALPAAEGLLATEPSAWTPLALWGQLLVLAILGLAWARVTWGGWQSWIVGVPVLGALGLAVADEIARLLPNVM